MDPELILFAIRSLIRLGREGAAAFDQYERDKAVLFPSGISAGFNRVDFITEVFIPDHQELLQRAPLAALWRDNAPAPDVPGAEETLFAAAVQLKASITKTAAGSPQRAISISGAVMIKQWASGKGPLSPLARIAITIADIGLDFVGTHPSVLGVGGTGGKLIGGLATNLSGLIPDGEQFGPKTQFAERAIGIFLRAGLTTLSEQSGLLLSKEQLQLLVKNSLKPVIDALPAKLADQSRWHDVTDALLGPAASTALAAIAANPRAFFGHDFDSSTAIGALTQALLGQASKSGLTNQFSQGGFIALYKAALGVVAERPELFLGRADKPAEQIASDLLSNVAATLKGAAPPFDSDLGIDLAVTVLDTLKTHGSAFILDKNNPWETAVGLIVLQVVNGLKKGLGSGGAGIKNLLSRQQLTNFAGVFLKLAVQTPGLLGAGNPELQQIVQGVARALSQDTQSLLTPEGWLSIASTVAAAALANPQRLFNDTAPGGGIGAALIGDLLAVAQAAGGRAQGSVLFGPTLQEAIVTAVRAVAGKIDAASTNQAALKDLATMLTNLVRTKPGQLGSNEWLLLYRTLIGRVLQGGAIGTLADAEISQILKGAAGI